MQKKLVPFGKKFVLKKPFKPVIDKMRKIITHFNKSPRQNEILQDYIEEELHTRLQLIKDSKTRWGSLHDSALRFLRVSGPLRKTLKCKDVTRKFSWTDNDQKLLQVIFLNKS